MATQIGLERQAVEAVLAFANLGYTEDPEEIYQLLEGPNPRELFARVLLAGKQTLIQPLYFQRLSEPKAEAARILYGDLKPVWEMLCDLHQSPRKARVNHGGRISELVRKGALIGVPSFEKGRVRVEQRYLASGVEAACGYGLALLYDASKPYGAALDRCPLETRDFSCERWFLRLARAAGGRSPRFCCNEHQRRADKVRAVDRARNWRNAHKKETSR